MLPTTFHGDAPKTFRIGQTPLIQLSTAACQSPDAWTAPANSIARFA